MAKRPGGVRTRNKIAELKRQIQEIAGPAVFGGGKCHPETEERFLEQVLAFEREQAGPLFDHLVQAGVPLPAPEEVSDDDLHNTLWDVIRALALLEAYLHCTDHLSDRELYSYLWRERLRELTMLLPHEPAFSMHLEVIGSGSEEDTAIYLRYYADEMTRLRWAREFPDIAVPAHEEPPYDRDRLLPQREWNNDPGRA